MGNEIVSNQEYNASDLAANENRFIEDEIIQSDYNHIAIDDNASGVGGGDGSINSMELEVAHTSCSPHQKPNKAIIDIDHDRAVTVLKAFHLMDDTSGSQKHLLDIINYGKELYCKGDAHLLNRWLSSWNACINVLKKAGYKDPFTYYA